MAAAPRADWAKLKRKYDNDAASSSAGGMLNFKDSLFFDWMYEQNRWGELSAERMALMADLVLKDHETFLAWGCYIWGCE